MRIRELESRTGVGRHALRYYERRGLLGVVRRSENNYRDYPESLVAEITLLRSMQNLGFSLEEIAAVLDGIRSSDIDCAEGARLVAGQRARVEGQIANLRNVSATLLREQRRLEERASRRIGADAAPQRPRRAARMTTERGA